MHLLHSVKRFHGHLVRILKGILGIHFSGHDLSRDLTGFSAEDRGVDGIILFQIQVGHRDMQHTVRILGHRFAQVRNHVALLKAYQFRLQRAVQQLRILMILIHVKHMVGRCFDHLRTLGQNHRLKYIDHLRDIRHLHTVAVFVEDVQVDAGYQSVTHGILLVQESRIGSRLHVEPGAPLVDDHAHLLLRIILVHDRSVAADQFIHIPGFLHSLIPCFFIKLRSASLVLPSTRMCVVVQRQSVHKSVLIRRASAEGRFHHFLCPLIIVHIRSAGNLFDRLLAVIASHIRLISAVHISVKFRVHVSSAAPVFISDTEKVHLP